MKKNMDASELKKSILLMQPTRPILCTTKNEDGSNHVAPFSWINPVSFDPPRVALALCSKPKKQQSLQNIERTGEFVVNLPDANVVEKLVETSYSTKCGENKFQRSGFTGMTAQQVEAPVIGECRAHLECRVLQIIDAGDHDLIMADVVGASYDEDAFRNDLAINLKTYQPVIHLNHYCLEQSQVHLFLDSRHWEVVDVPYPANASECSQRTDCSDD